MSKFGAHGAASAPPPPPGGYPNAAYPSAYPNPAQYDPELGGGEQRNDVDVGTSETKVRLGFLRKVYAILTLNFLVTVAIACAFSFIVPVRDFIVSNPWLLWVGIAVGLGSYLALACIKVKPPLNIVLLVTFVLGYSLLVGTICATYYAEGWGKVVIQAFAATLVTFVTITAYIFITKKDFSYLFSFLMGATLVLIVLFLLTFVTSWFAGQRASRWMYFGISVFGALLMIGYLLYDTSLVVTRLGPDQWIRAVVELYVDVINLFLYLLSIFSFIQQ